MKSVCVALALVGTASAFMAPMGNVRASTTTRCFAILSSWFCVASTTALKLMRDALEQRAMQERLESTRNLIECLYCRWVQRYVA